MAYQGGSVGPDILTSPASVLTGFGPRFDVEPQAEVGFWEGRVQGVDLITQRHLRDDAQEDSRGLEG